KLVGFLVGFVEFLAERKVEIGREVDHDGGVCFGWEYERNDHGPNQYHGHESERKLNRNQDVNRSQQHLQANKCEYNSQSGAEIAKLLNHARQQEVHCSQA